MTPARTPDTDIVVTGTGIAGLACALALARKGQNVGLLGPKEVLAPARDGEFDPRVYAISPASQRFLASIGAWELLPADRIADVRTMEIEGGGAQRPRGRLPALPGAAGRVHLSAWQAGTDCLAWIVEATELERALRQAVQWFGVPWSVDSFIGLVRDADTGRPSLRTESGRRLNTRLAIAADGAQSALRHAAGIDAERSDYDAVGLVVHLSAEIPHQACACQWFTPDGVLALLPMPDSPQGPQVSMVWSMPSAQAQALLALDDAHQAEALAARLAQATSGRLGALTPRGRLRGFPLLLQNSVQLVAAGIALVGDAAHVVHPLAGQGLNLGLGDVQALADTLAAREHFREVDDELVLRRYQRARAEPLLAMRMVTDGLYHLFETQAAPVVWLRNAGMNIVDRLPLLKRLLISGASGA
jgi:2-octaprenylphenol hydroxylase